jgi:hypothetical protein
VLLRAPLCKFLIFATQGATEDPQRATENLPNIY